ncbi:hypothetical protein HWC21_gp115 [Vibrio phage VAP7]|uniref:Uncharacterized protein n=1 Tax=Vibrio phage VAP7 TaxID=2584487 RepID=A0A4Y5TXG5_9CAUD|nr:hypothetical protein HWC21_gp115 [Vibrio phage VAP7]QDB73297.1 hypothetical protein [Vibrio phage VAP7]UFD98018.1 hypothetical protein [Vibrio phage BX-1]
MHKLANFKDLLKEESGAPGVQTPAVATTPVAKKKKKVPSHDGGQGGTSPK